MKINKNIEGFPKYTTPNLFIEALWLFLLDFALWEHLLLNSKLFLSLLYTSLKKKKAKARTDM